MYAEVRRSITLRLSGRAAFFFGRVHARPQAVANDYLSRLQDGHVKRVSNVFKT